MTEFTLFSGSVEQVIEFANLVVALFAGMYAVKLAALSQGGAMERTWNLLAVVAVLFVGLEVVNTLSAFSILKIHGLSEVIEFAFAALFAYCLYSTRKELLKKMFA